MWPYHRMSMAISLCWLGRFEEAKAALQAALKLDPTFTQAVWRSGSVYSDPKVLTTKSPTSPSWACRRSEGQTRRCGLLRDGRFQSHTARLLGAPTTVFGATQTIHPRMP